MAGPDGESWPDQPVGLANGFERATMHTRPQVLLEEMLAVVPWDALVARIVPFAPAGATGRPPYPVLLLLRVHFMQEWFALADEAALEALHTIPVYRAFAGIDPGATGIPDATTILRFRHLLERHDLATALLDAFNALLEARGLIVRRGTLVDATIVAAPSSTKNRTGTRDPGPGDAPDPEGEPVVLRHEGAHRGRRGLWPRPHGGGDAGQRARPRGGRFAAAR